jgi:hypothetical protein
MKTKLGFWQSVFGAFLAAAAIQLVFSVLLLETAWDYLSSIGVARPLTDWPAEIAGLLLLLFITVAILAFLLDQLESRMDKGKWPAVKYGVLFGVLLDLPWLAAYLAFNATIMIAIIGTFSNVASFAAAAWAYRKLRQPF